MKLMKSYNHVKTVLFLAILGFTAFANADPTGEFRYPSNGHSFDGNLLLSVEVEDPDGLRNVEILFNDNTATQLELYSCSSICVTSFSFTEAGINPRDLGLAIGNHTAVLWVLDSAGNKNLVDSVGFSWDPPEVSNINVTRTFGSFSISWTPPPGYNLSNLYISSNANISPGNIDSLPDSITYRSLTTNSITVEGVDDELGLFGLVTGTDTSGEGAYSEVFRIEALDNQDPTVISEQFSLEEDSSVSGNVLDNDVDPEGEQLVAAIVESPQNGSVELAEDGSFNYTPQENYNGTDTFTYTAADPRGGSQIGTVNLTITPINDAPVATSEQFTVAEDSSLTIDASQGLLTNDLDVDGDSITILNPTSLTAQNGVLSVLSDGSFSYSPNPNFNGTDSVSYQVTDQSLTSNVAELSINVSPVNDAPVAISDAITIFASTTDVIDVLANDSDIDGDDIRIIDVVATSGETTFTDSLITYTAPAVEGTHTITYTIEDPANARASSEVVVSVIGNQPPVANSDTYTTDEDTLLVVPGSGPSLLANDVSSNGDPLTVSAVLLPQSGTLTLNGDGGLVSKVC